MAVVIDVRIPAVPVGQPRESPVVRPGAKFATTHPVTTIKNADGSRKPHPIVAFKATVRQVVTESYSGPPLTGPLKVSAAFVFPRTKGQIWKRKPMPRLRHTKKPDRDNCDKALCDALTGILWVDDCQICAGSLNKWIAAGDEQPHVRLIVETIEE